MLFDDNEMEMARKPEKEIREDKSGKVKDKKEIKEKGEEKVRWEPTCKKLR